MAEHTRYMTMNRNQARFADWMADVLVYIVVLNLFVEYVDAIVIDSFTISIFTAILLKLMVDLLAGVEHRVLHFFQQREGTINRVLGGLSVFAILFLGKLLILEVVDIVFGDHVELGHFIDVVLLIIAMIASRLIVQKIFEGLGDSDEQLPADQPQG